MSGRWGDRPLGRGGWRVLQPEASSVLPIVPLRSRAAERYTGAIRPKPFYSGSRNQLPTAVTILLSATMCVDSPTGSFFSVLPGVPARLLLVPTYLFHAIRCFFPAYKAAKMSRRTEEKKSQKIRGKEAAQGFVGQIGGEPGRNVYGVEYTKFSLTRNPSSSNARQTRTAYFPH